MRILCYQQHLLGVGHFFRMHALACGLTAAHEVHLVDGGRPVPRAADPADLRIVSLPPLVRIGGEVVALDGSASVAAVMAERTRVLVRSIESIRPDAVLIDHYPFSKWEMDAEIVAGITAARRCNPGARVLCSLRDVVRQTRYEKATPEAYATRVLECLRAHFDGILVHADPAFTRLGEHFGRCADIPVPIDYTGFVAQPQQATLRTAMEHRQAVLSCGGGGGGIAFLRASMAAFRELWSEDGLGSMHLTVFAPAFAGTADVAGLAAAAEGGPFIVRRFGAEFADVLKQSELSISRAGYNTCVALLGARIPTVLVPDPSMVSDQTHRARRFAELGLARVVEGDPPDIAALKAAMRSALSAPSPQHNFRLDGVAATGSLIAQIAGPGLRRER